MSNKSLAMNKKSGTGTFSRIASRSEFTIGIVVIVLFIVASIFTDVFFTKSNLQNLSVQGAITGVLAIAQTIVIITGGIDISGGAISCLGCMSMALMLKAEIPLPVAIVANFAICIIAGFLNGVIVFDLKVPAMIATLGMQTILRGIIKIMCGGLSVPFKHPLILKIGTHTFSDTIPFLALVWAVVGLVVFLVLRYTIFGRNLFVLGSGIEVAKLSGIKVRKMFYMTYASAGLIYAIAALMLAGRIVTIQPGTGSDYDMKAIAAAVIGGASLAGGRGAITGTIIGTILMVIIENAGQLLGISPYTLEVITGVLIIFAVTMDMMKSRKKG